MLRMERGWMHLRSKKNGVDGAERAKKRAGGERERERET